MKFFTDSYGRFVFVETIHLILFDGTEFLLVTFTQYCTELEVLWMNTYFKSFIFCSSALLYPRAV